MSLRPAWTGARPAATPARLIALAVLIAFGAAGCSKNPLAPIVPESHGSLSPAHAMAASPEGDVIVRLRADDAADNFASSTGATVIASVPELSLLLVQAPAGMSPDAFISSLESEGRVEFAELNSRVEAAESRQSSMAFSESDRDWPDVVDQSAFTRVGAAAAQRIGQGQGVIVGILDTGIDLDHPALAAHLEPGFEPGVEVNPGDDRAQDVDTNGDGVVDGSLGHGTHVAGIVLALAPAARLLPVRVLDSDGVGYAFDVARGLVAAVTRGADVANLSLGMTDVSQAVAAAVDYAREAGVVVVAPTGNAGSTTVDFPASDSPVMAVAGTNASDLRAAFSNYGPGTDLAAPATGILSTYVGGGYASWSGTSMAAPFVSGTAAILYGMAGGRDATTGALVEQSVLDGAVAAGEGLGHGRLDAAASARAFITAGGDSGIQLRDLGVTP